MAEKQKRELWYEEDFVVNYQDVVKRTHLSKNLPWPGRVGYGERPAVLVIDMARAWTDPESPMGADMSDAIANIKRILDVARQTEPKIPVFFTVMAYDPSLKGMTEVHYKKRPADSKLLITGSKWVEIDPRLERRPDELLLVKEHGSAFSGTVLLRMLISNKCDTLIITGCSTSSCVMMTACDTAANGLHGIIPVEAVTDRDAIMAKFMLLTLDWKVVDVEPIENVLAYLSKFKKKA